MPVPIRAAMARAAAACALALAVGALSMPIVALAEDSATPAARGSVAAGAADMEHFFDALVKIRTRAVPDARSAASLGQEREGTGIVIGKGGLILTIGYLIVEADDVQVVDGEGHVLPAQVAGYDHATGFGLVRTTVPLKAQPLELGESAKLSLRDPVLVVNYDGASDLTLAFVVSKRPFTGNWEYLLDQAIFTSPPATNWSGAALVNRDLKLVGVGSLIVREADAGEGGVPGNMFVPIDALKPILSDLAKTGHRAGPPRPWLGVAADEVQGRLVVARVSPEGPGDQAGIGAGDIILAVGGEGVRTQAEFYRKVWSRGAAGADIPLRVLQGIDVRDITVHSIDRTQYFRPRTVY